MSDNVTALAIRRPASITGYNPPPDQGEFQSLIYMAKQLAEATGFVPAHFNKQPNKILAAMLYGRDLGITPTNALQHIIVIDGKATADAQLIGMLVRRAGHRLEDVTTDRESTVKITRSDDGSVHEFTFAIEDARRAGLLRGGSAWEKYPRAMLYARALTGCARKGAQDALMGVIYTPEELGAEVDAEGGVVSVPTALTQPTGEIPLALASPASQAAASGVPEAAGSPPATAIQPAPPAPSAEVSDGGAGEPGASPSAPPQTASVTPLGGPAFARRMGQGRSVGPQPKRQNVVTVEQGPTTPATAPEVPAQATTSEVPVPSQPAPPGLIDEPAAPAPVDDGWGAQRELLRTAAAELAHVNAIIRNVVEHAIKGEPLEEVPPATPSALSDEGLGRLIDRDYPGRTLANLDGEAIQNRLELVEANLSKKKALMLERGITEE